MENLKTSLYGLLRNLGWWGTAALTVGLALGSLAVAAAIVVQWPADQFRSAEAPPFWAHRHPAIRGLGLVGKNIVGYLTVLLGAIMSLPGVPGQGLLMMLIGLTLLNFPGKRSLERRVVRRPRILHAVNRLRARFKRPPLELEP